MRLSEGITARPVRWWECGSAYLATLDQWTGARLAWREIGLRVCDRHRWHRGAHGYKEGT